MLNFVERLDFYSQINEEITQMINALYGNHIPNEDVVNTDFSPKIVGQEDDGIIIYTWQCQLESLASTYVALYDQLTHKSHLIFTQEKALEIVTASVNTARTLVAFSIVERLDSSSDDTEEIYKSYIAEICPQNRVFSLNIAWRTFQKVQFLHETLEENIMVSHMLFFHHKESIGLYHIPVTEKDNRFMMSMQPSTQQIADQFLWSQFDIKLQRLYVVKLLPVDENNVKATAMLTVVDFHEDGEYQYILQLPLPISFTLNLMDQNAVYNQHYLSSTVCSKNFNMSVLTDSAGSFYVCYQCPSSEKGADVSDITSTSSGDSFSSDALCSVNYVICCIHGAYTVHCSYSVDVEELVSSVPLLFSLFNDYLLVFLPSSFLHLLDISCQHEPVHNLLLNSDMGLLPDTGNGNQAPLFSTIIENKEEAEQSVIIFENNSLKGYRFELCTKGLLKYFLLAKPAARVAILHASMNHFNIKKFTQKILKRACQDSANMETLEIFKEYLILATYIQMKLIVVSPLDLKIFPFTSYEVYRGQVERTGSGERRLYLFYKEFKEDIATNFQKILRKKKDIFWRNVFEHLSYEVEHRNKRFPLKLLQQAFLSTELNISSKKSFFREKSSELQKSASSPTLPTIVYDQAERKDNEFRNLVSTDKMVSYVSKIFGRETKSKALNMCKEYSHCRAKIISFLWKVIVKSLKFSWEDLMSVSINEPASEHDVALFQLTERLNCLTDQLCYPRFPHMKRLFCLLGFRCLTTYQFFQYVDAYVLEVDSVFVRRVLLELPNEAKLLEMKLKLISYLPKEDAHSLLREWNHEYGNKYLAKHIMTQLPSENIHYNHGIPEHNEMGEEFVPLRTLLESCKLAADKTSFLRSKNNEAFKTDVDFVGKIALAHTDGLIS